MHAGSLLVLLEFFDVSFAKNDLAIANGVDEVFGRGLATTAAVVGGLGDTTEEEPDSAAIERLVTSELCPSTNAGCSRGVFSRLESALCGGGSAKTDRPRCRLHKAEVGPRSGWGSSRHRSS